MITSDFNKIWDILSPTSLKRLSDLSGIVPAFTDIGGNVHLTSEETTRLLLTAMNLPANTNAEVAKSLKELEEMPWHQTLPPVRVLHEDKNGENKTGLINVCLPADMTGNDLALILEMEDGSRQEITCKLNAEQILETRDIDGQKKAMFEVSIAHPAKTGSHKMWIKGNEASKMPLFMAPAMAFQTQSLRENKPVWGVSTMIWELVSDRNWGIGDFRDLEDLAVAAAAKGASTIGINPLHDGHCPYYPDSRIYNNPIYIAVDEIPGFNESHEMQQFLALNGGKIAELNKSKEVDKQEVSRLKNEATEILYSHMCNSELPEKEEFEAYCDEQGEALELFATNKVLNESHPGTWWGNRDEKYRDPSSKAVAQFADINRERVNFYKFQQWLIERQLSKVNKTAKEAGLQNGLYGDLAVGIDPGGTEAWAALKSIFKASIGAPPDPLGPNGQGWGTTAYMALQLFRKAYSKTAETTSAVMKNLDVLRIDHAMNLYRLFCIPPYKQPGDGAYVNYPMDDLLGILKIISHRNECMIIGEDLGTVPEGFREKMAEAGILSYKVQWFERDDKSFRRPGEYAELALACVETHDMAPLKGYWDETDIDERLALNLYAQPEDEANHRKSRSEERKLMLALLEKENLLPDGYTPENPDAPYSVELGAAIHKLTISSKSHIVMISAADLEMSIKSQNVPGTSDDMRPANWRQKLGMTPKELMNSPLMHHIEPALTSRHNPKVQDRLTLQVNQPVPHTFEIN